MHDIQCVVNTAMHANIIVRHLQYFKHLSPFAYQEYTEHTISAQTATHINSVHCGSLTLNTLLYV